MTDAGPEFVAELARVQSTIITRTLKTGDFSYKDGPGS
jgi:hypothetical protein